MLPPAQKSQEQSPELPRCRQEGIQAAARLGPPRSAQRGHSLSREGPGSRSHAQAGKAKAPMPTQGSAPALGHLLPIPQKGRAQGALLLPHKEQGEGRAKPPDLFSF